MAENANINKVVYGGQTLIDLTGDTVIASGVARGQIFHDKSGAQLTGTNDFDADTSDADAVAAEILLNKSAYVNGNKLVGTMPNNGTTLGSIVTKAQEYTIPQGYHDGSGKVSINGTEQSKIIPNNIKSGITILGVVGTYGGEAVTAQAKTATPSTAQQVIIPDAGYDYLSQVTVNPIPYVESDNAAGGKTATIAAS